MIGPNFTVTAEVEQENYGKFVIEPLDQGFGHTLGNSLRRTLLSALPGAAVTTVKVNGVKHQFSTMSGVKEDMIELILNLKNLRVRLFDENGARLTLEKTGPGEVTAADFAENASVEVVNKDLYLASLSDKKTKLEIEVTIEKGYGYSPASDRKSSTVGVIPVDAIYTPITRVNFDVEETRVGRMIDLDKLTLEIFTDGTISPRFALEEAAKVLVSYTQPIFAPKQETEAAEEGEVAASAHANVSEESLKMTIDELDLPTRIYNSLRNGGIDTVGQLLSTPRKELSTLKNVGEKSISIIEEKLKDKGITVTL